MESFNQMPQKSVVKNEVSDNRLDTVDHSDTESLHKSSSEGCESPVSGKRTLECEQDLHSTDASGSPLPPRKRAKTQEEKEQRRMERIMRNRQAAHASREKKRKHLESLEHRCSDLERENTRLSNLLSNYDQMCSRLHQLEAAVKAARTSGDISSLDSTIAMVTPTPTMDPTPLNETVNGMLVGAPSTSSIPPSVSVDASIGITSPIPGGVLTDSGNMLNVSGSPAPSLEEDCASPEALLKIKTEEELFLPYSPETVHSADFVNEDPFGMMNFSFEPDFTTSDANGTSESSSKSRHPAAVTPLFDYYT